MVTVDFPMPWESPLDPPCRTYPPLKAGSLVVGDQDLPSSRPTLLDYPRVVGYPQIIAVDAVVAV